ncbi:enoyl-CoA hydratase-related protein [Amycolatopsis ultiminotia]|uniref:Enoyl-CoA hydratase-related protein n=1 Tax=Amycolatopsis ultiminotia TaxID=543629 RepID=A0ABP6V4V0_9PSEU
MIDDPAVDGLGSDRSDGVVWLTLERPEARNALTIAMRRGLIAAMQAADVGPGTRVVVLTGTDPAFSAGIDLKESLGDGTGSVRGARTNPAEVFRACTTPVIGAINGLCYTGALELALSCDFLIASERACFADTHAAVGMLAGWGMSALLPRAVGARLARQMMLTGAAIDADQALRAGLVNEVVPHEQLRGRVRRIVDEIRVASPASVAATRDLPAVGEGATLAHALGLEAMAKLRFRTDPADVARRFAARISRR